MAANIALLLDLNCFPIRSVSDSTSIKNDVKWMQEYVLTLMSKAASDSETNEVDFTKILWAYKFFNSTKNTDYRTKNKFESFTISTFEAFEKNTISEFEKFQSENQDYVDGDNNNSSSKISNLSQALMRIISDFDWTDTSMKNNNVNLRNTVYVILRVPRNDAELKSFVGDSDFISSPSSRSLLNVLLPPAFHKAFNTKYNIQMNFIDTGFNFGNGQQQMNEYSKQIVQILDHLNKGTVTPMVKSQPAPPGLPSYFTLLKNSLKQATESPASKELSGAQKVLTQVKMIFETSRTEINSPGPRRPTIRHSQQLQHYHHTYQASETSSFRHKLKAKTRGGGESKVYRHHRHDEGLPSDDSFLYNKNDCDSSMSEELNSCIFEKNEAIQMNRYLQNMSARKFQQQHSRKEQKSQRSMRIRSPKVPSHHGASANDSILSNSQQYSRSNVEKTIAKKRQLEKRQWHLKIKREEAERQAACVQRKVDLEKFSITLEHTKDRLNTAFLNAHLSDTASMGSIRDEVINFKEKAMADKNQCILSLAQSIVHFIWGKLQAKDIIGQNAQEYFAKYFYLPVPTLKTLVAESLSNIDSLYLHFRECQLQILYRMEISWLSGNRETYETVRDEIIGYLRILSLYCQEFRVQDFISDVLVHGYLEVHAELLIELYRELNLEAPVLLLANLSPNKGDKCRFGRSPSRSSFRGSSITSPFGSSESVFHPPSGVKYGTSKVAVKRFPTQDSFVSNKSSARYTNHVYVNNPKKQILVSAPKAKLALGKKSAYPKSPNVPGQYKGHAKPKQIRRNLFHVDKNSIKDSKSLHSLAMTSHFSRSPSVSSSHKSSRLHSQSPRNRLMRNKRKRNLDDDNNGSYVGSPDMFSAPDNDQIICPGTPSYKPGNSCKKVRRSLSYQRSSEKKVITESPEIVSKVYQPACQLIHSLSFYSTGSDSFKSRAWEKSGHKMMAAKIKRTVDTSSFMNTGLHLSDLEIYGGSSPDCKSDAASSSNHHSSIQTPKIKLPPSKDTPLDDPCCSKSLALPPPSSGNDMNQHVEVVQANVNANIEALIRNDQPFAISSALMKTNSATPTKKISFNFDERRIKTPVRNSPATPKSILKTPNRNNSSPNESDSKRVSNNCTPAKVLPIPPPSHPLTSSPPWTPLVYEEITEKSNVPPPPSHPCTSLSDLAPLVYEEVMGKGDVPPPSHPLTSTSSWTPLVYEEVREKSNIEIVEETKQPPIPSPQLPRNIRAFSPDIC